MCAYVLHCPLVWCRCSNLCSAARKLTSARQARIRQHTCHTVCAVQKGDNAAVLEAKKKDMEMKRAVAASKGEKVFYKVTVKVNRTGFCTHRSSVREPSQDCDFAMQQSDQQPLVVTHLCALHSQ